MPRDTLQQAIDGVETGREHTADGDIEERLTQLESHLESQANRDATPALGTLDRIHTKLGEVEDETSDSRVAESVATAREHILRFLDTLDDRGMKQH